MDFISQIKKRLKNTWDWFLDLDVLQWVVPLFLSVTAIVFELVEHLQPGESLDLWFDGEVLIFGFMGPIIIAVIITWMRRIMAAEEVATAKLQSLNRELENKVSERTAALAQRNAELDRLNTELRDLDEMKSDFVSLVSHELRAPLTALNGGLELALQSSENLPPRSRAVLEIMTEESTRLTNFVQTILDVSRLDAGKLAITFGPVAVLPLMEQAAAIVLASGQRKVEWIVTPDLPPIWGDETYLEQVIRNLISNADKYSPADKPIQLCAESSDDTIRISVKDYGRGIPADIGERIFSRFSRLESEESSPPGWGLGLYLGRKLIEAQNGKIGFVSPIWKNNATPSGTEFYILMPVAQTPEDDLE
ncbi:MAG: sensor histidine kinase [Limisphaerales bacterium]